MMQIIKFECTLLTDLVISSEAATEGFHKSLDYIPGSKFLGIVAKTLYREDQPTQTLDLFHNGMVRYGDAHRIGTNSGSTYRMPFSWYISKGKDFSEVYLYHELTEEKRTTLLKAGIQLETIKPAYFNMQGEVISNDQLFSIKSAYDSVKYRAEDEKMYGYFALQSGSRWQFDVEVDKSDYILLLEQALVGKQRIGRSSSAEYGLIEIKKIKIESAPSSDPIEPALVYLYAISNWCFYDESQRNTAQPDPIKHLMLPTGSTVDWGKSQLRTRTYKNWNRKRNNRDADRVIIEKGSVLAVHLGEQFNPNVLVQGIGMHRAEGFGKVLVNPPFLIGTDSKLLLRLYESAGATAQQKVHYVLDQAPEDEPLLQILNNKTVGGKRDLIIDMWVNCFINEHAKTFQGITSSQWGQIRNIAKFSENASNFKELAFNTEVGACYKGKSESIWRKNNRRKILESFIFSTSGLHNGEPVALAIKLSAEMAKRSS